MNRAAFEARITVLIGKGVAPYIAERMAKRERRLASPQHKRAVGRNLEAATLRFEATCNAAAFKALEARR